jgi:glycosyltransferase involved in cell wall biosynthesis
MRIAVVNYEYPPLGGGGGVLSRTLVADLTRRHEVIVLTSRAGDLPAESYDDGAHVVRVPVFGRRDPAKASLASLLTFGPAARRRAASLFAGSAPDVVHTFFAVPSGPAGAWIARRAGAPHVLTVIGADVHDPTRAVSPDRFAPLRRTVTRVVTGADEVTAISRDIAQRAKSLTGRADIVVVPCAVEPPVLPREDRGPLGWKRGEFVVLTIARLVERKGLDTLVEAVGKAGPPVVLEVVGDGPQRADLERLAESAAPGRVRFAGAVDGTGKGARLAAADAFALVSLHEGFGLVYLEAMHAGLPVVAGDVGGQVDFLRDGVNALLVHPSDPDGLAAALRRLAGDKGLRRSLVEGGSAIAAGATPARMAAAYEQIYEKALASRRARA